MTVKLTITKLNSSILKYSLKAEINGCPLYLLYTEGEIKISKLDLPRLMNKVTIEGMGDLYGDEIEEGY